MNELENPMVIGDYYEQPHFYGTCDECGKYIYGGDEIFRISDMLLCTGCVQKAKGVAEND